MKQKFIFKYFIVAICFFMTGSLKAQTIEVEVNEYVELMSILSRMAGFPEYSMDLGGQYITDMDSCFHKHRSHPTVSYMKDLRKNQGVSFDAVMDMAIRIQRKNDGFQLVEEEKANLLDKRWDTVNKEEFLSLLEKFYQDTEFHSFFIDHASLYQEGIKAYKEKVLNGFNQDWYSKFYGIEAQEKFGVIIGFCNGGGNYGIDRHRKGEIKEVYAVVGYYVNKEGIPQYNADYLSTLIHEFNHSFINYLLDMEDNREAMREAGETLLASSFWAMSRQAYSNWETVVNESLVRAAVICYMLDNGYSKEDVRKEMNEQLQRNFRWIPELVRTLRKYEQDRHLYPNLESFYPQIIRFFHEYIAREEKYLDMIS